MFFPMCKCIIPLIEQAKKLILKELTTQLNNLSSLSLHCLMTWPDSCLSVEKAIEGGIEIEDLDVAFFCC